MTFAPQYVCSALAWQAIVPGQLLYLASYCTWPAIVPGKLLNLAHFFTNTANLSALFKTQTATICK